MVYLIVSRANVESADADLGESWCGLINGIDFFPAREVCSLGSEIFFILRCFCILAVLSKESSQPDLRIDALSSLTEI